MKIVKYVIMILVLYESLQINTININK